jgi:hypothetical protein
MAEWIAFYEHEPWGYEVEERRHAQSLAMQLNCVPRAKGSKFWNWTDLYRDPWGSDLLDEKGFTEEQKEFLRRRKKGKSSVKRG